MRDLLYKLGYTKLLPLLQTLFRIMFALALPIFIGSIIIRLFLIVIGRPLGNKRMPLIGVIIALILGYLICMAIPYLKEIETSLINAIGVFRWEQLLDYSD